MKNACRVSRQYSCQSRKNWFEYLTLFGGLDTLNQFLVILFFRWITTSALQAGEIPFISY